MMLIKAGIDLNQFVNETGTPLQWALFRDQFELAYILLQNGADPSIKNFVGYDDGAVLRVIEEREIGAFGPGEEKLFKEIEDILRNRYRYTLQCEKKYVTSAWGKVNSFCIRAIKY